MLTDWWPYLIASTRRARQEIEKTEAMLRDPAIEIPYEVRAVIYVGLHHVQEGLNVDREEIALMCGPWFTVPQ